MFKFISLAFLLLLVTGCLSYSVETKTKTETKGETKECWPSATTASGTHAPREICSGQLIFEDHFDRLDFGKWKQESTLSGGGNWEFQWYTNNRSNSYTRDGRLFIKPTLTADFLGEENLGRATVDLAGGNEAEYCTDLRNYGCLRTGTPTNYINPARSCKMSTMNSFSFKYGTIKVRAKLPRGDWLWPAIWMLPRYNEYGGWPTSGEIDIMEGRGNENYVVGGAEIGIRQSSSTLHWGPSPNHNEFRRTQFLPYNQDGNYGFRVYELHWTPEFLKFKIDDQEVGTVQPNQPFWDFGQLGNSGMSNPWVYGSKLAPFDQEFYIIFNVAVGGTTGYFPDGSSTPKPWSNTSPQPTVDFWNNRAQWLPSWRQDQDNGESAAMEIDWVQVWAV